MAIMEPASTSYISPADQEFLDQAAIRAYPVYLNRTPEWAHIAAKHSYDAAEALLIEKKKRQNAKS